MQNQSGVRFLIAKSCILGRNRNKLSAKQRVTEVLCHLFNLAQMKRADIVTELTQKCRIADLFNLRGAVYFFRRVIYFRKISLG